MTDLDPRPLTRSELAQFLPSQRAIRAFEKLFELIPSTQNSLQSQTADVEITAGTAMALVHQVATNLEKIADVLEKLHLAPIPDLEVEVESFATPQPHLGSIAEQEADNVSIEGGNITAILTDSSQILIASGQSLADGSAAATGTLLNAPTAGNPSKWVSIDDNGTTRYVPAW